MILPRAEVAVVGAACPLGRHLLAALRGRRVRAVVREASALPAAFDGIETVCADLRDLHAVRQAVRGADAVVWLAHATGDSATRVNAEAVAAARDAAPGRFVLLSSGGSVYGAPLTSPVPESHPRAPLSEYGRAKRAMEDAVMGRAIVLRPGNIYGSEFLEPGGKGVIAAFARALAAGTPVPLVRFGRAARDFVHVDDVVSAIELALSTVRAEAVWNVGSGVATPVAAILAEVCAIAGVASVSIEHCDASPSDVDSIALASDALRAEGWSARIGLPAGLRRVVGGAAHHAASSEYGAFSHRTSHITVP